MGDRDRVWRQRLIAELQQLPVCILSAVCLSSSSDVGATAAPSVVNVREWERD